MDLIFCDICVDAKNSVENLPKLGTGGDARPFLPLAAISRFQRVLARALTTKMSLIRKLSGSLTRRRPPSGVRPRASRMTLSSERDMARRRPQCALDASLVVPVACSPRARFIEIENLQRIDVGHEGCSVRNRRPYQAGTRFVASHLSSLDAMQVTTC